MAKIDIKRERVHRPQGAPAPSPDSFIEEVDDVVIQLTQAFCPKGHDLVLNEEVLFDGEPGISLWVSGKAGEGEVILSPYHGDHTRQGKLDFHDGDVVQIACPVCKTPLPRLSKCSCSPAGELVMLYLTPRLDKGQVVGLCTVWGCHRSKVFDQAQLLRAYMAE